MSITVAVMLSLGRIDGAFKRIQHDSSLALLATEI